MTDLLSCSTCTVNPQTTMYSKPTDSLYPNNDSFHNPKSIAGIRQSVGLRIRRPKYKERNIN